MSDTENHFTSDYDSDDSGSNYSLSSPISTSSDEQLKHEVVPMRKEKPESSKMAVERSEKTNIQKEPCPVCAELYTTVERKPFQCHHCGYTSCKQCIRKLVIMNNSSVIRCMNCKNQISKDEICEFFPKTFSNQIQEFRKTELLQHDGVFNSPTMPFVKLHIQHKGLKNELDVLKDEEKELTKRIKEIKNMKKTFVGQMRTIEIQIQRGIFDGQIQGNKEVKFTFIKCFDYRCKGNVDHRGFCIVCKNTTCIKCHLKIKDDEEHTCKEEDLKSVKFIENQCNPCPKCKSPVQKDGGCRQVYCFLCRTAFDFYTGRIENDRIHAHDYFALGHHLQNPTHHDLNGHVPREVIERMMPERNIEEDDCILITSHEMNQFIRMITNFSKYKLTYNEKNDFIMIFLQFWGRLSHIIQVELADLPYTSEFQFNDNIKFRIRYISGEVSEEKFKTHLLQKSKEKEYLVDVRNLYQVFADMTREMGLNVCRHRRISYLFEYQHFYEYSLNQMDKLSMKHFDKVDYPFTKKYKDRLLPNLFKYEKFREILKKMKENE